MRTRSDRDYTSRVLSMWTGFWRSKVLFAAAQSGIFEAISQEPQTSEELASHLGLDHRMTRDVLEVLTGEGLIVRRRADGVAKYGMDEAAAAVLTAEGTQSLVALLRLADERQYAQWGKLNVALRSGEPVGPNGQTTRTVLDELAESDVAAAGRLGYAIGNVSSSAFSVFASKINLQDVHTVLDIGGSTGTFSIIMAKAHPKLHLISFDSPHMAPFARERINRLGLSKRIDVQGGNFFEQLPSCDFAHMSNILHDWTGLNRRRLLENSYSALCPGGRLAIVGPVIGALPNSASYLVSLNIRLEMGGEVPTLREMKGSCEAVGFEYVEQMHVDPNATAVIFTKPQSRET